MVRSENTYVILAIKISFFSNLSQLTAHGTEHISPRYPPLASITRHNDGIITRHNHMT